MIVIIGIITVFEILMWLVYFLGNMRGRLTVYGYDDYVEYEDYVFVLHYMLLAIGWCSFLEPNAVRGFGVLGIIFCPTILGLLWTMTLLASWNFELKNSPFRIFMK